MPSGHNMRIALRNILRNRRRTLASVIAVAVCATTILVSGAYFANLMLSFKTSTVIRVGHLSISKKGFQQFGVGNPGAYGIADYPLVLRHILADPVLASRINVATPTITVYGMASNAKSRTSKAFYGIGWVASEHDRMLSWDEYGIMNAWWKERIEVTKGADRDNEVTVGDGLAAILRICPLARPAACAPTDAPSPARAGSGGGRPGELSDLVAGESPHASADAVFPPDALVDLVTLTQNGSPSALTVAVRDSVGMGLKELGDSYIGLNFGPAQRLLYDDPNQATTLVVQLHHSRDIEDTRNKLRKLFLDRGLPLEVHTFDQVVPLYGQVMSMFSSILGFLVIIMAGITLFTITNTMSVCVMERTNEIGTMRALGVQDRSITGIFLLEGACLGGLGALLGCVFGAIAIAIINSLDMTWMLPGNDSPIPLQLTLGNGGVLIALVWLFVLIVASLASTWPAYRATRMNIVDALRHN